MRTMTTRSRRRIGAAVPLWIWIVGGIIVALVLLTGAVSVFGDLGRQSAQQSAVDQFNSLGKDVKFLCQQAAGAQKTKRINIGNGVLSMFAADTRGAAPDDVPNLVSNQEMEAGDYLCLSFKDSHYGCQETVCPVNMTYIGQPMDGTDMYELGARDDKFTFELTLVRKEHQVEIQANHVP